MSPALALIIANFAAAFFMAGLIWTIQVVHYPLFWAVGREAFPAYESGHQRRIAAVVAIPWAIQVATALALVIWRPDGVPVWLPWTGLAVALGLVVATVVVFAPLHRELREGLTENAYHRLVNLNWVRTAFWSSHAVIAAAILVEHIER